MSIYQRESDKRWVVCVKLPSEDGKRKRKYVYANSEKIVKRHSN
ncbi:MAG: hypothetical protein CVV02_15255 [Firmicutes bacterium HGW-Firmicutes-7]|nr:MAG: hypothetical protein CVV02_15255 [Firmicutes bacterium HGW-Firmicutes-7]